MNTSNSPLQTLNSNINNSLTDLGIGNVYSNVSKTLGNTYNQSTQQFNKLNTTNKLILIVVIILVIGLLVWGYHSYVKTDKVFIPDLENPAEQPFQYIDSTRRRYSFIPNRDAPQTAPHTYTYSVWMYIRGQGSGKTWGTYRYGEWKHVLHRGSPPNRSSTEKGTDLKQSLLFQSPGIWLDPTENRLYMVVQTDHPQHPRESFYINDVPLNRWFNLTVTLNDNVCEIYLNCKLESTFTLYGRPTTRTNSNIYITQMGGFPGYISYLQYFNNALTPVEICNLYNQNKPTFDKQQEEMIQAELSTYKAPTIIPPSTKDNDDQGDDVPVDDDSNGRVCIRR